MDGANRWQKEGKRSECGGPELGETVEAFPPAPSALQPLWLTLTGRRVRLGAAGGSGNRPLTQVNALRGAGQELGSPCPRARMGSSHHCLRASGLPEPQGLQTLPCPALKWLPRLQGGDQTSISLTTTVAVATAVTATLTTNTSAVTTMLVLPSDLCHYY